MKIKAILLLLCAITTVFAQQKGISTNDKENAITIYQGLNDSKIQQQLRGENAWFSGPVLFYPGNVDREKIRYEMQRVKDLGFNVIRYHPTHQENLSFETFDAEIVKMWLDVAHEVGLKVIIHIMFGTPTEEFLQAHGYTANEFKRLPANNPDFVRLTEAYLKDIVTMFKDHPAISIWAGNDEPGVSNTVLSGNDTSYFADWLREKYHTIEALNEAWNVFPDMGPLVESFEIAWRYTDSDIKSKWINGFESEPRRGRALYGAQRDMIRYQTEKEIARTAKMIEIYRKYDDKPITIGAHNLFLNQPMLCWDIGEWARTADMHITSIHLPWHFSQVDGEVDRPVYMQSRLTRDYFKYGFTSAFETTCGAVQYSGGYGNSMDANLMRRLMLNYVAAGNMSMAFWAWNHRPGGWEVGEYGMIGLDNEITPWAIEAGIFAKKMGDYAEELWKVENRPKVGILQSWNTDAILLMEPELHELQVGDDEFAQGTKMQCRKAQIGISRALINHNIPFEYITEQEILEGIALYYPVIYVPHARALSNEVYKALTEYVNKGGRLIGDVQFGFLDEWGKLRPTGKNQEMDKLFGTWLRMIHVARTQAMMIGNTEVEGFFGEFGSEERTNVLHTFTNGQPAITEYQNGRGSAVLIGFDAALMCHMGNPDMEKLISTLVMNNEKPTWTSSAPMTYRLYGEVADHIFIINDGETKDVTLRFNDVRFKKGKYVLEDKSFPISKDVKVKVDAYSGIWLRLEE